MRIAITGASGLIGSHLLPTLSAQGDEVTRLVRHPAESGEVSWNPQQESLDLSALDGFDGVIHLAGENIASSRWTTSMKGRIRESRVRGTHAISSGLARLATPPKVLIAASAIGYYGNRGAELLDEQATPGEDFLAKVVYDWEQATEPAANAGIRVVRLRIGVVLSPAGGALAKMLTPFQLGAGGRVGNGRQYWSWIAIDDVIGVIRYALSHQALTGPINAVTPTAITNAQFTQTLGRVLHRPTFLPMPATAARIVLGEMADALLLSSTRVVPKQLLDSGYSYQYPELESALRHLLNRE
ncbi:MAG: TIGR01777 family oxidoreductase [Pirellulales bacterium]